MENVPVMFAKPQTFMNLSGESVSTKSLQFKYYNKGTSCLIQTDFLLQVASLVAYFKVPLNQVIVVHNSHLSITIYICSFLFSFRFWLSFLYEQIYDDLDLPFASLKLLPKGGHGGHNGYLSFSLNSFSLPETHFSPASSNLCVCLYTLHVW